MLLTLFFFQRLIFYLNKSNLVDKNVIERILGTTDEEFPELQPDIPKKIGTRVLGELATNISTKSMETVVMGWLGITSEEVNEKRCDSFRGSWLFNLAILEIYTTRDNSSLEVMTTFI